jgi:N-sulfoglucosamine sulfohydrolase
VPSPALDQLAGTGVRYERSFCTAPQCSPSRASLHTGRYPHTTGVLGLAHAPFGWRLDPSERHFARILGEAGYSTSLIGMQHLIERDSAHELGYQQVAPVMPAYEEADVAVAQLRKLSDLEAPFYLEVGFEEPHRPYDFGGAQPDNSRGVAIPPYLPNSSEAQVDFAAFQGAIRQMDDGVGRILAAVDELGLADDLLVVFATDHGAAMPRAKCTLYDPGIEVALLLRYPAAGLANGRVLSELVSNVDVVPTLLEALGLPAPSNLHGRSLWPLLRGASYVPREEIFAEKTYHTHYEPMRAIRTDRYKLIVNLEVGLRFDVPGDILESPILPLMIPRMLGPRPPLELYDLERDRWEETNLADTPEVAEVQADLRARLLRWMEETEDPLLRGPVRSPYLADALARLHAP